MCASKDCCHHGGGSEVGQVLGTAVNAVGQASGVAMQAVGLIVGGAIVLTVGVWLVKTVGHGLAAAMPFLAGGVGVAVVAGVVLVVVVRRRSGIKYGPAITAEERAVLEGGKVPASLLGTQVREVTGRVVPGIAAAHRDELPAYRLTRPVVTARVTRQLPGSGQR